MEPQIRTHKGHRIELRPRAEEEADQKLELVIDDERVPYGQLPDGLFFLDAYAYDWTDNLLDLAVTFIDYRERADEIRRQGEAR